MLLCNYKGPHYDHRKCNKNVHSLKNKPLSCPHFVKTTTILSKILCPHVIFQKNFMINIPLSCPCLVKKCKFCRNYTILWAPKVNRMYFFPVYLKKNNCSRAHISSKKCPFAKNHNAFMPIFCHQNVHSLKTTVLSCH